MDRNQICAVIPAAGRGSRLGMDIPKLLVPVDEQRTIWSILRNKLLSHVDHLHVVLSPAGYPLFQEVLSQDERRSVVSCSIQDEPLGMGDAIFRGQAVWSQYETIFVVWGDQIYLSQQTIRRCLEVHAGYSSSRCTLPLVAVETPYVQYVFDQNGRLGPIRQSREGDRCDPWGDSDVGAFVLSVAGLHAAWQDFLANAARGTKTGEINFLPFLTVLSQQWHWPFQSVRVHDATECRGINTPEDLAFFRRLYSQELSG